MTDQIIEFPTSPDDVDTIRVTWLPSKETQWCRGGETLKFPKGSRAVKIEHWLAVRPFGIPIDPSQPDVWEETEGNDIALLCFEPRASIIVGNN